MIRWEYRMIDLGQLPPRSVATDILNSAGAEGWEFVGISANNIAYTKRKFEPVTLPQSPPLARSIQRNSALDELRGNVTSMLKEHGLSIRDLFGKGPVAAKYRDPKNAENTWTGRGRMPRWLVAATKGGKAKKEDFLI